MSIGAGELWTALSLFALVLIVGGLIAAFSIARARKHGSTTLALDVTRNTSVVWMVLMGLAAGAAVFTILLSDSIMLDDTVYAQMRGMTDSLLTPPCEVSPGAIEYDCGSSISPVPFVPRLLVFLGAVLLLAASAAIAWAIYTATRLAGQRTPFHPRIARTFGTVAIIVMATAVPGQLMQRIGMTLAANSLDWPEHVEVSYQLELPLWPFAVAVGLFALSAIFRYGAQVQNENARLHDDNRGLV